MPVHRASPTRLIHKKWFVFVSILLLHGAFAFRAAPLLSFDGLSYAGLADTLIAHSFDLGAIVRDFTTLQFTRVGYVVLLAALKVLAGDAWTWAAVTVNLLCEAVTGTLLVATTIRYTRSVRAGWIAFVLFLTCFEIFSWTRFVLSDPPFLAIIFGVFVLAAKIADRGEPIRVPDMVLLAGLLVLAFTFRPPAVAILPTIALAVYVRFARPGARFAALVLVAVAAVILVNAYLVQDPDRWPFRLLSKPFHRQSQRFAAGEIVTGRPKTYIKPRRTLADFTGATLDRTVRFFQFMTEGFSTKHNALNFILFAPLCAGAAAALVALIAGWIPDDHQRSFVLLSTIYLFSFALFHGLTQLDFDWRYRVPAMPAWILLAAFGLDTAVNALRHRLFRPAPPQGSRDSIRVAERISTAPALRLPR